MAGLDPAGGMDVSCECYVILPVEVSAMGWSLMQGSPSECECVIVFDHMEQ